MIDESRPTLTVFTAADGQAIGIVKHDNVFLSTSTLGPFIDADTLIAAARALWPNVDHADLDDDSPGNPFTDPSHPHFGE